jgi:S1-C subfamily serine protease
MGDPVSSNALSDLSNALAATVATANAMVAAIRLSDSRHLTGTLWQTDAIVASEQSLPKRDSYDILLPGGVSATANLAGRDAGTNVAVLKLATRVAHQPPPAGEAHAGSLALAFGADGTGGASVRLGVTNVAGPAWHSSAGGLIDRRIILDIALARAEEGGPVLDATGARLGFSTFGPRRQVLVIPTTTVDRVVPQLLKEGRVARGWLGAALQPVAVPDALHAAAGQSSGMMVMSIADDGPCARAGVLAGDILVAVGDQPARRFRRIATQLGPDSIGRQIDLKLIRGGAVISLKVTIAARPEA